MTMNWKLAAALVLVLGVGLAAGAWWGFRLGTTMIIENAAANDAKGVRILLSALADLKAGKTAAATETLEARVDDHLVVFDPQEPYPLTPSTSAAVDAAILAAKEYRAAHPRRSKRAHVDEMVQNLFRKKTTP